MVKFTNSWLTIISRRRLVVNIYDPIAYSKRYNNLYMAYNHTSPVIRARRERKNEKYAIVKPISRFFLSTAERYDKSRKKKTRAKKKCKFRNYVIRLTVAIPLAASTFTRKFFIADSFASYTPDNTTGRNNLNQTSFR